MAKITLIGDAHGKIEQLLNIYYEHPEASIQLGDMGCGFVPIPEFSRFYKGPIRFIRGNHDNPSVAQAHPNYLGEFGYLRDYDIFYMGGAFSIDYAWRQQAMRDGSKASWWEDEELSSVQLNAALQMYEEVKPRIVVSHECPSKAAILLLQLMQARFYKADCANSRTSQIMQQMMDIHQPELWVFGHYHFSKNFTIDKTRFVCLNELETFELDTEKPLESFYE